MKKYFVTMKRNAIGYTSIKDLEIQFNKLFNQYPIQCQGIELDSLQRLHLHAIIHFKKTPYFKHYTIHGWHVYFIELAEEAEEHVVRYINKHSDPMYQTQMEFKSYSHYNNLFTD